MNFAMDVGRSCFHAATGLWRKNQIYYVAEGSDWSVYWDGYYITKGLKDRLGVSAHMVNRTWGLRNQIIHYGNRYAFLYGPYRKVNEANRVFLTWFHGDPDDPDPQVQHLFSILPEAAKYVLKVVVTCQISREILIELGIPKDKLITIPLGVELGRFCAPSAESRMKIRTEIGIPKDTFCIGSFQKDGAGWGDGYQPKLVKGPDIFLQVIQNLAAQFDNLIILLTGPARGYVKRGLAQIGVPYIHHHLSNYHDIVRYYQALDLYLITSRSEGGPKALLEGWATGAPVVSTRVGMPADLIKHSENGMLSEVEDVNGLVQSVCVLIEDEELRARCRNQGFLDIRRYDWSLVAEQYYYKLYEPLLV